MSEPIKVSAFFSLTQSSWRIFFEHLSGPPAKYKKLRRQNLDIPPLNFGVPRANHKRLYTVLHNRADPEPLRLGSDLRRPLPALSCPLVVVVNLLNHGACPARLY